MVFLKSKAPPSAGPRGTTLELLKLAGGGQSVAFALPPLGPIHVFLEALLSLLHAGIPICLLFRVALLHDVVGNTTRRAETLSGKLRIA